jgi:antitoxin ParD1/3/4
MKVVTVHLPEAYVDAIDELVRRKLYPNRAEAIRMAVRDLIRREGFLLAELAEKREEWRW